MPLNTERTQFDELTAVVNSGNVPDYVTFHRYLPMVGVTERAGALAVMPVDGASEGVETEVGADRTAEMVSSKTVNYSMSTRTSKRTGVYFDEEPQLDNNIDNIISLGGGRCAREYFRSVETAAWTLLGTTTETVTLVAGTILSQIQEAVDAVTVCGEPILVITRKGLRALRDLDEVKAHLTTVAKVIGDDGVIKTKPQAFAAAIADLCDVAEVIVVDDTMVAAGAAAYFFVMGRRPEAMGADNQIRVAKANPVAAAIVFQRPAEAPATEFPLASIYGYADNKDEINYFDAQGRYQGLLLNDEGVIKVTLPSDESDTPAESEGGDTPASPEGGEDEEV